MEPKKIISNIVLTTAVIYLIATYSVIPGMMIGSVYTALVVAVLMGLLNIASRMMLPLFHVPIILLAIWVSAVVLNTASLMFLSLYMDQAQFAIEGVQYGYITLEGFLSAFLAGLIISAAQSVMNKIFS